MFSYNQFAAGANRFGIKAALSACVTYAVPLETALMYRRRYAARSATLQAWVDHQMGVKG